MLMHSRSPPASQRESHTHAGGKMDVSQSDNGFNPLMCVCGGSSGGVFVTLSAGSTAGCCDSRP